MSNLQDRLARRRTERQALRTRRAIARAASRAVTPAARAEIEAMAG